MILVATAWPQHQAALLACGETSSVTPRPNTCVRRLGLVSRPAPLCLLLDPQRYPAMMVATMTGLATEDGASRSDLFFYTPCTYESCVILHILLLSILLYRLFDFLTPIVHCTLYTMFRHNKCFFIVLWVISFYSVDRSIISMGPSARDMTSKFYISNRIQHDFIATPHKQQLRSNDSHPAYRFLGGLY